MQGGGEGGGGMGGSAGGYRSIRSRTPPKAMGDINVTPLVDVVLVLLLVFMITAPMMNRSIDVSLPVASLKSETSDRITVTVTADGSLQVNGEPTILALLTDRLRGLVEGKQTKVIYLRADESLRYGKVIEVVDHIKQAGVEQVGFVYVLPQEKARR